jgi:hypothetical protein
MDDKKCFNMASMVLNAVLEMSEQFVVILFYVQLEKFSLSLPDTMVTECIILKINNFLRMEKNHLTVHFDNKYTCAKSISIDCNKAIASKFDSKLILKFALLLTKHNKEH